MTNRKAILSVSVSGAMLLLVAVYWVVPYDNYHTVIESDLHRSAQVNSRELRRYITRDGLRTVINLRDDTNGVWWIEEKAICEQEGVVHVDVPLRGDQAPTMDEMRALIEAFRTCERPLLIHCKHGADRTALATALYLLECSDGQIKPTSAFAARYGHLPRLFPRVRCFDTAYAQYASQAIRPSSPAHHDMDTDSLTETAQPAGHNE